MVWCRVQRSGRTTIFATTRSLSASVNVTPFSSAKGIFIELIFSSGVISPPEFSGYVVRMDGGRNQGNDVRGNGGSDKRQLILHIVGHAKFPSPPDRVPDRRDGGDAVSARRAGPYRRRIRLCGAPA